jgi:N-acetylgalactosamine-6-sulfatase
VPFIARWPAQMPAGVKNETTVLCAVDLLPTFCAAAGVTPPNDAKGDGENLLPAFQGKAVSRTRPIFWLHKGKDAEPDWWPRLAVRDGKWKLLTTYDGARTELYDLTANRAEDAAKDQSKQQPEIVARLTRLVLEWYATLPTEANPECIIKQAQQTKQPPEQATKVTPGQRVKAFSRWDTDKDGSLTLDEYKAGLKGQEGLEARFKHFDKDGDGKLTLEEFVGRSAK